VWPSSRSPALATDIFAKKRTLHPQRLVGILSGDVGISRQAAVAILRRQPVAPNARPILAAGHGEGIGLERGKHRLVAGGEMILGKRDHLISPVSAEEGRTGTVWWFHCFLESPIGDVFSVVE